MSVSPKDIEVGKCYVTPSGQVRRVLKIETKVTYESRGKRALPRGKMWGPKTTAAAEKFAVAVDKEVNCEHDPNYPQQKP